MMPSSSASSPKSASGRPPVANKNLRALPLPWCPEYRRAAERRPPVDPYLEPARNQLRTLPAYHVTLHAVAVVAVSSAWLCL
jgi:hypothetical protein